NNTFQGVSLAAFAGGLALTGNSNQVVSNSFSYLIKGISLIGDDPSFHTAYGIATNTSLIGNRFCNVNTLIDIDPLVTGTTNQGTLMCPWPPPTLSVAAAILLSWPAVDIGYVVECATNAAGPWTLLGTAPIIVQDEFIVTAKASGPAKFF